MLWAQDEIVRFEEDVIHGGPIVLPGAIALLEQVRALLHRLAKLSKRCSDKLGRNGTTSWVDDCNIRCAFV